MKHSTRRQFIQHTGAAAGFALAAGYGPLADGDEQKIRVGLIGVGARARFHLREGLFDNDDLEIVAIADFVSSRRRTGVSLGSQANAQIVLPSPYSEDSEIFRKVHLAHTPIAYREYREMLQREPIDAVIIATPPHTHHDIVVDCLGADKHVFCETPLATNIADARNLVLKVQQSNSILQVGHQRRYHPNYNLVMKQFREDHRLGRLTQMEVFQHQNTSQRDRYAVPLKAEEAQYIETDGEHYFNWRRYTEPPGGPCFDAVPLGMDTANWFCESLPTRVYAAGGVNYWKGERDTPDNLSVIFDYKISRDSAAFLHADGRSEEQDIHALNRSYALRCNYSFRLFNESGGTGERLIGDKGHYALSPTRDTTFTQEAWAAPHRFYLYSKEERQAIRKAFKEKLDAMSNRERRDYRITHGQSPSPPEEEPDPLVDAPINAIGSEELAEVHQFRAFAHHIRHGGTPRANVMVGLAAVIAGASARKSLETGNAVDIDPAWMEFDFETPSISDYDKDVEAIEA